MSLSSSEAEWMTLSEAIKEVMFIVKLLQTMNISVKLLVTIRVDNVGAMFMAGNVTVASYTKHVDIIYK